MEAEDSSCLNSSTGTQTEWTTENTSVIEGEEAPLKDHLPLNQTVELSIALFLIRFSVNIRFCIVRFIIQNSLALIT